MPVSQTSAKSALSSAALASRNGFSDGEPDSSSPSNRMVMLHGSVAMHLLPGAAGLDEGHQLALVVGRAAAGDHLVARSDLLDRRRERIVFPQLDRIDRLHVVMAIEQHMRRAGGPVDDGATTIGWPGVSRTLASKPISFEIRDQPFGRLAAVGGIGRIGGDRLDPQQRRTGVRGSGRNCGRGGRGRGQTRTSAGVLRNSARGTLEAERRTKSPEPLDQGQIAAAGQKNAAVVEGEPRRPYLKRCGSPERGIGCRNCPG